MGLFNEEVTKFSYDLTDNFMLKQKEGYKARHRAREPVTETPKGSERQLTFLPRSSSHSQMALPLRAIGHDD